MPPVSDVSIEQVRLASDIVEVIQAYTPLKRAGSTFRALCPFHQEKTPSFHVNPQRQFYHCFGCGAGGDVFKFVMAIEKTDFMTALRLLAKRAGISLAQDPEEATRESAKDRIFEINEQAAAFFHNLLMKSPEADAARSYLQNRDIDSNAAREFMLGFAPNAWNAIVQWGGKKFPPEQLAAAGLVIMPDDESHAAARDAAPYDRFRNRLMFPIRDELGRAAGFSGRLLAQDPQAAKYVNTPETPVFHKSRILYGLHNARRAMAQARQAILCEGQIDVIRCRLAGFHTAVAAQGTAFTSDHARILKRYADGVIMAFDADAAGQKAALRALEICVQAEMAVRIALIPGDDDPDSLIRRNGPEPFQRLLDHALSAMEFCVHDLSTREDLKSEIGLMRAAKEIAELIARVPNQAQKTVFLREAAGLLKLPESALLRETSKYKPSLNPRVPTPNTATIAAARL